MSGICGIVNWDGKPVDPELLKKMAEAAAYRGPDGIRYWIEGNIGFAHLALNTTPESLRERQPLVNRRGDLVLTADARVDNRDELIRTLTSKGYIEDKDPTDADLILASYECWGEDCPKYIVGDFAFAVWDKREQKLFCARDPIGIRLLHYKESNTSIFFSTAISCIIEIDNRKPFVNRELIKDLIAGEYDRWICETAYENIRRLPQSYSLIATQTSDVILKRYWVWGTQEPVRFKTDSEYIAYFKELFVNSVRAQSRSITPISIIMSGGLDSTSVACVLNSLIANEGLEVTGHTFSGVFEQFKDADERPYIEKVTQNCTRLKSTLINCDDCWGLKEFGTDNGYYLSEPDVSIDRALSLRYLRFPATIDSRVAMTGEGADNILGSYPYHVPRLYRDVKLAQRFKELPFFCEAGNKPWYRIIASAYLGGYIRSINRERKKKEIRSDYLSPPNLNSEISQLSYSYFTDGLYSARLVLFDSLTSYAKVEFRLPFFDRSLVDFALTLPARMVFQQGLRKFILREAMTGLLPEEIRMRKRGADFAKLNLKGLFEEETRRVKDLLNEPIACSMNYIDKKYLLNLNQEYIQRNKTFKWVLIRFLCAETWLRVNRERISV